MFAGFYQNYAVTTSGEAKTWGLKGYIFGTDNLGRDILTRIVNGGQVTMTVGAVAVIISLFIGVLLGGVAGYFGGFADMAVMRVAEVIGGLPFLPFAMILSAIIGHPHLRGAADVPDHGGAGRPQLARNLPAHSCPDPLPGGSRSTSQPPRPWACGRVPSYSATFCPTCSL